MDTTRDQNAGKNAMNNQRMELLEIKQQLIESMGDSGEGYWNKLRAFVTGRLSMQEFESFFRDAQVGENARIHNHLILSILKNAISKDRPPKGVTNSGFELSKKRKLGEPGKDNYRTEYEFLQVEDGSPEIETDSRSKKQHFVLVKTERLLKEKTENPTWSNLKEIVKNMNKHDKKALKYLLNKKRIIESPVDQAIKMFERIVIPVPPNRLPPTYALDLARGVVCSLCFDTKSTPDMKSLQARMVSIALQRGLVGGVTNDSVELLLYGLDCHLKNIASNMISKVRSNRSLGIPVENPFVELTEREKEEGLGDFPSPKEMKYARLSERIYQSRNTLHLSDLLFSLDVSPFIAVENPACLERGFAMLSRQETADQVISRDRRIMAAFSSKHSGFYSHSHSENSLPVKYDRDEFGQDSSIKHIKHIKSTANISLIDTSMDTNFGAVSGKGGMKSQFFNKNRLKGQYERHYGPYVSTNITPES